MLRLLIRRSRDVSYLSDDPALELEGLRDGPAQWWLRGTGDVSRDEDALKVLTTSERSRVVGYDVVIAAPRPVSILVAVDPSQASAVIDAHRGAVREAMEYLEERALVVRDRRGGDDREIQAPWAHVASFTHGVNRHGEPHLHDHVLVGARPDGARGVLDSRALFAHARAADALYRSSLRAGVARATPHVPWRSFEGVEHVAGLDEGYRVLWGGHFADRGAKLHWTRDDAQSAWERDLERFETHGAVVVPPRSPRHLDEHSFRAALEGRPTIARRHVVEAWANAATFGRAARDVTSSVDLLYPAIGRARGVREESLSLRDARMISETNVRGPRPLDAHELDSWRQRSRDRSRDGVGRSR
ncbi:MAG TPA: relaxase domain-containing protein [Acidimicrobiales bacterium]